MSRNIVGQQWRGLKRDEWFEIMDRSTVVGLQNIVDTYSQEPSLDSHQNLDKIHLMEQVMQVLDKRTPELSNEQIMQIFAKKYSCPPNKDHTSIAEVKESVPTLNSSKVNDVVGPPKAGTTVGTTSSLAVIRSYLKSMHHQRIRRVLASFLQEEYHQSSSLEKGYSPYLPPSAGGRTVSTLVDLDLCLVAGEQIMELRIEIPPKWSERQLYFFSQNGGTVAYRGRGPSWHKNSCAIDCCLVAARLLNIGITKSDRGTLARDDWLKNLTPLEEHFLRMAGMPWEKFPKSTCINKRDEFYESLLQVMNTATRKQKLQNGSFFAATAIWRQCTSKMQQFAFQDYRLSECTACKHKLPRGSPKPTVNQEIALDVLTDDMKKSEANPSWSQLINKYFDKQLRKCGKCGQKAKVDRRRVYGNLPLRLVVLPGAEYRSGAIGTDSDRMSIKYEDSNGHLQEATYRWLGGIFRADLHFRLYWTDEKQGEGTYRMMVYDGQLLDGSIIGSILPKELKQKVPEYWAKETDMLFYERIDLLNPERLQSTAEVLKTDIDIIVGKLLTGPHPGKPSQDKEEPQKVDQMNSIKDETQGSGQKIQTIDTQIQDRMTHIQEEIQQPDQTVEIEEETQQADQMIGAMKKTQSGHASRGEPAKTKDKRRKFRDLQDEAVKEDQPTNAKRPRTI